MHPAFPFLIRVVTIQVLSDLIFIIMTFRTIKVVHSEHHSTLFLHPISSLVLVAQYPPILEVRLQYSSHNQRKRAEHTYMSSSGAGSKC